ncbi:MAG: hypothetical protein DMG13_05760 [Acidobacteria bacterium]|nr:MAG: hypothetical protein DMG13_05760 [Acidobacteriota bacterium]
MLAMTLLLMQFMVSARAGLVNDVDGQANVGLHQQVPAGAPIQTGPQSHVEILLNPGSFLRLDENSTIVLDSVELTNIAVRVVTGAVLIESAGVDKHAPIRVTTGNLRSLILARGVYRFSGDTASVIDGKLRPADSSITVKKGQEVTPAGDGYEKVKLGVNTGPAGLERWSERRSSELARANAMAYRERSNGSLYSYGAYYPEWGLFANHAAWLYSPLLSGFTFIPQRSYRSYWGYRFVPRFVFAERGLSGGRIGPGSHPPPRAGAAGPTRGTVAGRSSTGSSRVHGGRGRTHGHR